MSTYSTTLRIELIGAGQQDGTWGDTTNSNLGDLIEAAITNVADITFANATYTLTAYNGLPDEARNAVLNLIGTNSAQQNLVAPAVQKTYIVKNDTGANVAITAGGANVIIQDGATQIVYCDGTDFLPATIPYGAGATGTGNLVYSTSPTIASPTFTGTPIAPTAAVGTDTTQVATTAFVRDIIPTGIISMWYGSIASVPSGWYLCDGNNGTPDLRDRFVVGAGTTYAVNATGGAANVTPAGTISGSVGGTSLTEAQMPKHYHNYVTGQLESGSYPNSPSISRNGNFYGGTPDDGAYEYNTYSVGGNASSGSQGTGTANGDSHNHSAGTLAFTGTSGSNLPPYYALAYIMKA